MNGDGNEAVSLVASSELDAIRQRRQHLAELREMRQQLTDAEVLDREKRDLADDEAIDRLEQEHGRIGQAIAVVRSDVGAVVVKRPHMATFRKFQDDSKTTTAMEKLVRPCVLHPSKTGFDQMCEDLPFLLQLCANAVCTLAGVRVEETQAKQ